MVFCSYRKKYVAHRRLLADDLENFVNTAPNDHSTTSSLKKLGDYLMGALPKEITKQTLCLEELTLDVLRQDVLKVLAFLRDDPACLFKLLIDICGTDYPERAERFDVVYHLLSIKLNQRIRVKITTDAEHAVPSSVSLFSSAGWYEREVWDLLGVYFENHPDLRRILTDYGFIGHPLRKDFPLTGYVEVRYDDEQKRVVYEKVKLTQEFRTFDFMSPWEGMTLLPGDEKANRS